MDLDGRKQRAGRRFVRLSWPGRYLRHIGGPCSRKFSGRPSGGHNLDGRQRASLALWRRGPGFHRANRLSQRSLGIRSFQKRMGLGGWKQHASRARSWPARSVRNAGNARCNKRSSRSCVGHRLDRKQWGSLAHRGVWRAESGGGESIWQPAQRPVEVSIALKVPRIAGLHRRSFARIHRLQVWAERHSCGLGYARQRV